MKRTTKAQAARQRQIVAEYHIHITLYDVPASELKLTPEWGDIKRMQDKITQYKARRRSSGRPPKGGRK